MKDKLHNEEYRIVKNCLLILKIINDSKQVNAADLVEILGVSKRTVYRYLNVLREVGYKIEYNQKAQTYEIVDREKVDLSYIF